MKKFKIIKYRNTSKKNLQNPTNLCPSCGAGNKIDRATCWKCNWEFVLTTKPIFGRALRSSVYRKNPWTEIWEGFVNKPRKNPKMLRGPSKRWYGPVTIKLDGTISAYGRRYRPLDSLTMSNAFRPGAKVWIPKKPTPSSGRIIIKTFDHLFSSVWAPISHE